jgi:glycosyltransferase involved in cell wall biosynthesis
LRHGIKPDLIYLNTLASGSVVDDVRSIWPTVPILSHIHEMPLAIDLLGRQRVFHQLEHSSHLIACSDDVVKGLAHLFPDLKKPVVVIPEPVRPRPSNEFKGTDLRKQLGIHSGTFVLGSIGSADLRKGFDLVPQILSSLQHKLPSFEFVYLWIGCNKEDSLYKIVAHDLLNLGLSNMFFTLSNIPDPTELLADFDLLILPSREDPYPLVALEAFQERVPVICFQHAGGISSLARQGFVKAVPYLNVEALAEAVLSAAREMAPFAAMSGRAASYAQHSSDLNVVCQAILDAIDACLSQRIYGD